MNIYTYSCKTPKSLQELESTLSKLKNIKKDSLLCLPEYFLDRSPEYSRVKTDDAKVLAFKTKIL